MLIESLLISYLSTALPDCRVAAEVPDNFPEDFMLVICEKTGGGQANRLNRADFAIQSYGKTMYDAAVLSQRVVSAMENLTGLDEIAACRFDTEYNWPDMTRKRCRYQAVFHLTYYDLEE